MEKIDLSSNSKQIQSSYDKVVRGDPSATYVVYTVDKNLALSVESTGNGTLDEFVENFVDGSIQFGLARVTVPGSDVSKVLLLGWCPDNSPAKLRLSFASNFAEVSKVLSGYHVQITARDQDDLDVDEFLSRIGAAAGARYSLNSTSTGSKPKVSVPAPSKPIVAKSTPAKPSYVPKSTGKPIVPKPIAPKPAGFGGKTTESNDGWGEEKEIEERDFSQKPLEDLPSAYKPTKVDINELRKQKSDTISSQPKARVEDKEETIKPVSLSERLNTYKSNEEGPSSDGRLTSLPKPKVNNSVASRFAPAAKSGAPSFGAKPVFGSNSDSKKDKLVGGLSRNFAAEGGKTPAQLWAEKRGQYKSVSPEAEPEAESSDIVNKFQQTNIRDEEPEEEEEQEEEEQDKPVPSLPTRNLPPPPVKADQPEEEQEEQEQEEEEEEEEEELAAPSLPVRNLPPPPNPDLPVRNLPPPPARNVPAAAPSPAAAPAPAPSPVPTPVAAPVEKKEDSVTAVAEYDYEKDEDNELSFAEGDLIIEIDFVDDDWWSGKHSSTGEVGLFPATYVSLKEESSAAAKTPEEPVKQEPAQKTSETSATAEYDYEKDEDNEISFSEGDVIVEIEFVDEDWWSGKHSKSGEVGLFPANYVKLN